MLFCKISCTVKLASLELCRFGSTGQYTLLNFFSLPKLPKDDDFLFKEAPIFARTNPKEWHLNMNCVLRLNYLTFANAILWTSFLKWRPGSALYPFLKIVIYLLRYTFVHLWKKNPTKNSIKDFYFRFLRSFSHFSLWTPPTYFITWHSFLKKIHCRSSTLPSCYWE